MKLQGLSDKAVGRMAKIVKGQEDQSDELERLKNAIREIHTNLAVAVGQSVPEDDQIIMNYVRDALEIAKQVL